MISVGAPTVSALTDDNTNPYDEPPPLASVHLTSHGSDGEEETYFFGETVSANGTDYYFNDFDEGSAKDSPILLDKIPSELMQPELNQSLEEFDDDDKMYPPPASAWQRLLAHWRRDEKMQQLRALRAYMVETELYSVVKLAWPTVLSYVINFLVPLVNLLFVVRSSIPTIPLSLSLSLTHKHTQDLFYFSLSLFSLFLFRTHGTPSPRPLRRLYHYLSLTHTHTHISPLVNSSTAVTLQALPSFSFLSYLFSCDLLFALSKSITVCIVVSVELLLQHTIIRKKPAPFMNSSLTLCSAIIIVLTFANIPLMLLTTHVGTCWRWRIGIGSRSPRHHFYQCDRYLNRFLCKLVSKNNTACTCCKNIDLSVHHRYKRGHWTGVCNWYPLLTGIWCKYVPTRCCFAFHNLI